ncbi:alpha-protein kinase 1-like [Brachionichthys hirsutus]|uniref:alpha-protein kinase 1-like n=1 Tax=Brachionichthys hirsutus TaxID=412623 RepID=UPI003604BE55
MDSQQVGDVLEECLGAVAAVHPSNRPTEAEKMSFCRCRDSLCDELASLLQEAVDMKWPFAPEKWQYKQSVSATDKTNLSDLISKNLPQLLAVLKASIAAQETSSALATVFLVDRFLYWTDDSRRLLKIAKLLHRRHRDSPVSPQLVIRQARVYLNAGKLQKAEYILSSLINYSGATGCWVYHSESDRALVQAVSVQVRGMILQKLGLWPEAAELIWASLVGYYALPQPDKKGIGTSLGLLANILVSMNDEDFHVFKTNPDIDLSLLGDGSHRLLSAAQAAKMAVIYSQYTSLYVLTNVVTQGTCLSSYSFSMACPASQRQSYLLQAKEAFSIGLLTKAEGELVTSKQELHTFLKAAYSLTVVHKWLGTAQGIVAQATGACQKALSHFYEYDADTQNKDGLCTEIMHLVTHVKLLLQVEPFFKSDKGSFIPDGYRNIKDTPVSFTLEGFAKVMQRFQKYHASLCETSGTNCNRAKDEMDGGRLCITALETTVETLCTESSNDASKGVQNAVKAEELEPDQKSSGLFARKSDLETTVGSTDGLGSSWHNFSLSSSGSPRPGSIYAGSIKHEVSNQSCLTTEAEDDRFASMLQSTQRNNQNLQGFSSGVGSLRSAVPATSSSNTNSDSEKFDLIQAGLETSATDEDVGVPLKPSGAEGAAQSMSRLTLRTSCSSLSGSFSSQSSWEKISVGSSSPDRKPRTKSLPKARSVQSSKSSESDGSFCLLETLDSESDLPAHDPTHRNQTSGSQLPPPLESLHFDYANAFATPRPNLSHSDPDQCASTENSTESSFEMVEENQSEVPTTDGAHASQRTNPLCYSCLKSRATAGVAPESRYVLSQQDYQALLAGVCMDCLLKRLHSDQIHFKLKEHRSAYSALHLKFSKATGLWTARETCVYIGEPMGEQGKQRMAIWVTFLHQEERLSSYVGKDYLEPRGIQFHLKDVERQMTAQHYVTEFNKSLYDKEVMAQIFFIPSEALLILNGNEIVGCVTVEPYMLGDFVKLTNNTWKKDKSFHATEYGLAFGHFTYLFSDYQEVVVDLQGWVTANGKGLTYLTDPQIHSTKAPKGPGNFAARGLKFFLEEQHGPECNGICHLLTLPPLVRQTQVQPQKP